MEKVKIHELAKKLKKSSKEIMDVANKLGIEIKSHLSTIEGKEAESIEKEMNKTKTDKQEKDKQKQDDKKQANSTPVIIRREVIISDEEIAKKEEKKAKEQSNSRKDVGFIERNKSKEFNIVYREKPSKPMTASELFGLKPKKEEVEKKEEVNKAPVFEEKQEPVMKEEIKQEVKPMKNVQTGQNTQNNYVKNSQNTYGNNRNNNYNNANKPKYDNNKRNFGDNRQGNNGYNRNDKNGNDRSNQGNKNQNRKNFGTGNYQDRNNRNGMSNNNRRMLDERGIEKNIKNIIAQDIGEKEILNKRANCQICFQILKVECSIIMI